MVEHITENLVKKIVLASIVSCILAACGKQDVSFSTLEDARNQARENAMFNAQVYRSENPRMQGLNVVGHGDSTQSPDCPQGDGWASLSLMGVDSDTKQVTKFKIKCSTVSAALGCYTEQDFQTKPFSKDEGRCANLNAIPFPLPKIAK